MALWARLLNSENAYGMVLKLISLVPPGGKVEFEGGLYSNLWTAHPPFQIDANFGYENILTPWHGIRASDVEDSLILFSLADSQLPLLRCCFRAHRMTSTCSLLCRATSGPEASSKGWGLAAMWPSTSAGRKGSFEKHCYGQAVEIQLQDCITATRLPLSQFAVVLFTGSTGVCSAWRHGRFANDYLMHFPIYELIVLFTAVS